MRRALTAGLVLALLLSLAGCAGGQPQVPANFYYRRAQTAYTGPDGVIAPEVREIRGMEQDLDALLDAYFSGPEDASMLSPFPRESQVLSWQSSEDALLLTMNEAFCALSGIELSIACACIAKTMLELTDAALVQFQAEEGLLGGEKAISISLDNLRLYDNSLDQSRADFTLYYTDRSRRYLLTQTVSVSLAAEDDIIAYLLDALTTPASGSDLQSALPTGTQLLDYTLDDGLCTVNLSREFELHGWSAPTAQRLSLLAVVNTLTQLPEIQQVEFRIEGNLLVQYRLLNIPNPLVFEEGAIGPVRTGMNEFDATLYLSNGTENYLAGIPTRLRQSTGITQAELVVQALLDHSAINGFYSTIPADTQLNRLTIRNGICYIDLNGAFVAETSHLTQSVHSIIASVCALSDISRAQITVEGQTPQGDYGNLFSILSPQSDWFL